MTAAARITSILQIRPNEIRLVALITGLMFAANMGLAIASPGIEALFYARFGVEFLPIMYIILGLVTPMTSIFVTALLARTSQERFYLFMPLVMALLLVGARLMLVADLAWLYPVLWLGMSIFWLLQSLFSWGLAGFVCDTRQAKRLFPLFGVGAIIGMTIGSFLTPPLVNLFGAENLILMWSLGLLITFALAQRLVSTHKTGSDGSFGRQSPGIIDELRKGFIYVRDSPFLRWISLSAVLFAILYYAIVFPFASAVTVEFPDEDQMAAFLGAFQGLATGVAILASLFFANRLYARFGFMAIILVYPVIYLVGFAAVAVTASFAALVIFRFVQIFWAFGMVDGANQAIFNVVPPEQREKSRTFIRGVANQLGISLAGVMLLLSQSILEAQHLFMIGVVAAAVTIYLIWQARRAYGPAVVAALRAGQSHIFFSEEQPFGGFRQDATAVAAATAGINSPEVTVRRIAADILGNLSMPEATNTIVSALGDEDASVRAALLRAIGRAQATPALLEVAAHLQDPDPEVRLQAVMTLRELAAYPRGVTIHLQPLIHDPEKAVSCHAAATLLKLGPHPEAEALLKEAATASSETGDDITDRIYALEALAFWGSEEAFDLAAAGLNDSSPAIRRTSATIMSQIDAERCIFPLYLALADEDELVREAVAKALGHIGEPALELVVSALKTPEMEEGALLALQQLPARNESPKIEKYAGRQVEKALHYHRLWGNSWLLLAEQKKLQANGRQQRIERCALLTDTLQDKALKHGANALRAMAALGSTQAINLALDNLASEDSNQRANAMETLDSIGDPHVVRPLLPLWDRSEPAASSVGDDWLADVLQDADPWVRACAALAAAAMPGFAHAKPHAKPSANAKLAEQLAAIAENDPDPLVRESAGLKLNGDPTMDTLQTLPIMERVLFLRRVPLFAELPPNDLKQIAAVATEMAFGDGAIMATQGEPGDAMFIIVSGEVVVTATSDDGSPVELGRRQPGEYVGEMSIISDEVRMATLTASGDVRTLSISQAQFKEILRLRPEASLAVMAVLSDRLREQWHSYYAKGV